MEFRKLTTVIACLCLFFIGLSCSPSDSKEDQESAGDSEPVVAQNEEVTEPPEEPETSEQDQEVIEGEPEEESVEENDDDPEEVEGPNYENGKSSYLFDQNQLHTFELNLSEQNLAYLDQAPGLEEYVSGTLTFEGETLPVGIRYKGSVGAWVGCLSGSFFEAEGEKTCTKLSMKVKINWEDSDDTFFEVKKLQFHSQNLDPTKMHERLGYWLFREMGVPAPRSVHARLIINGEYNGIFALTEQIDGRFTRENFADGTGNLYKEIWPITTEGEPKLWDEEYQYSLKTNEDEDATFDIIQDFVQSIVNADKNDRPEVMKQWMEIEEVIAYAVVDRAIANDDGVFHWYCDVTDLAYRLQGQAPQTAEESFGCNPHNFYWYEDPTARTVHLIPWDLDNSFSEIQYQSNPVTPIKDKWGEITNDCLPFAYGGWGLAQKSAACDPIIGTWTEFEELYRELSREFLLGPFAQETVEDLLNTWAGQIKDSVIEASETHDDQPNLQSWLSAIERLKNDLEFARGQISDRTSQ